MAPKLASKLHPDLFKVTHQMVVDAIRANLPRQTSYDQVKIIQLSNEPTDEELARFYAEIHNHLLEVASTSIGKNVEFFEPEGGFADEFVPEIEDDVPVLRPHTQNLSFFVVELLGGPGQPRVQFAIRHDNLYCVGFRVLYDFEDPKIKPWFSFGEVYLLKCVVFPNVKPSKLSESYASVTAVQIYPKLGRVFMHCCLIVSWLGLSASGFATMTKDSNYQVFPTDCTLEDLISDADCLMFHINCCVMAPYDDSICLVMALSEDLVSYVVAVVCGLLCRLQGCQTLCLPALSGSLCFLLL